jgi:hypothetical protein
MSAGAYSAAAGALELPASPYRGLATFGDSEVDARFFFGRERDTEIVAANVMAARLTVLYGPTGVGKSSMLRAGVARHLRMLDERVDGPAGLAVVVFSAWRDAPVEALGDAARATVGPLVGAQIAAEASLAGTLAGCTEALGGEVYVLLDQVEEYSLYHDDGSLEDALADVVNASDLRVHTLLGIREDALATLDAFKPRIPQLLSNYVRLDALDRDSARRAIVEPLTEYARLGGETVTAEPALVEAVLDEVAQGRISVREAGGAAGRGVERGRVEAPYLQLVLQRLWETERARGSTTMHRATLAELGGAEQIVGDHLERALTLLAPEQKDLAATVFNYLVTPSGTKIAHDVDDLVVYTGAAAGDLTRLLAVLAEQRIVRPVAARDEPDTERYEIFHDVLAEAVVAWRTRHAAQQGLDVERAEGRRRQRRLFLVMAASLVALAVVASFAVYALAKRSDARRQATSAEARAFSLGAEASLDDDPELSMLLALEASRREPGPDVEDVLRRALERSRLRGILPRSRAPSALRRRPRLARAPGVGARANGRTVVVRMDGAPPRRLRHDALVGSVDVRPGLVATAAGKLGRTWAPRRGRLLHELEGHEGTVNDIRFSPNGEYLATASSDGTGRLWSADSGEVVATLIAHANHVTRVAFSPDSKMVATASRDGTARLWSVPEGRPLAVLAGHRGPVTDVAFTEGGRVAVTIGADGTVRRWDAVVEPLLQRSNRRPDPPSTIATSASGRRALAVGRTVRLSGGGAPSRRLPRFHTREVLSVAFSADGRLLVTTSADADVRVWESATGGHVRLLRGHFGPVVAAAFSPDARWIVTAGPSAAALWEVATKRLVYFLRGHQERLTAASFAEDGRTIVTADRHETRAYRCETCGRLAELISLARRRLAATGRELTRAERDRFAD